MKYIEPSFYVLTLPTFTCMHALIVHTFSELCNKAGKAILKIPSGVLNEIKLFGDRVHPFVDNTYVI
jgi:hypothetical protein